MTAAKLKARYDFGQGNKFGSPTQAKVNGEPGTLNKWGVKFHLIKSRFQ
jgi:hypothetical protein